MPPHHHLVRQTVVGNGELTATLVRTVVAALLAAESGLVLAKLEANVRFRSTTLDQMVPATTITWRPCNS